MATPTLKAARSNRVGHATKDLLRRWAGQIFYCTHRVQDLNVVHIGGKAACSALLPMTWQSEAAPYRVGHATSPQASLGLRRLFCFTNKPPRRLVPLRLLSAKGHARILCSVVNALTTKISRTNLLRGVPAARFAFARSTCRI